MGVVIDGRDFGELVESNLGGAVVYALASSFEQLGVEIRPAREIPELFYDYHLETPGTNGELLTLWCRDGDLLAIAARALSEYGKDRIVGIWKGETPRLSFQSGSVVD